MTRFNDKSVRIAFAAFFAGTYFMIMWGDVFTSYSPRKFVYLAPIVAMFVLIGFEIRTPRFSIGRHLSSNGSTDDSGEDDTDD